MFCHILLCALVQVVCCRNRCFPYIDSELEYVQRHTLDNKSQPRRIKFNKQLCGEYCVIKWCLANEVFPRFKICGLNYPNYTIHF